MRNEKGEFGGVTLFVVGIIVAAGLLVGGIYLLKHNAKPVNNAPIATTENSTQNDVAQTNENNGANGGENAEQPPAEQNTSSDDTQQSAVPTEETSAQTQTDADNQAAQAGPTQIASAGGSNMIGVISSVVGVLAIGYAVYYLRKSERAVIDAALKN